MPQTPAILKKALHGRASYGRTAFEIKLQQNQTLKSKGLGSTGISAKL